MMGFRENIRQHGTVHLVWIICLLIASLILIVSVRLGTDSGIKDILNFAVALASLVLALVAIIQALLSGITLTDTVSAIRSTLSEISKPASKIEDAAAILSKYSENIGDHANTLKDQAKIMLDHMAMKPSESSVKILRNYGADEILPNANESSKIALYIVLRSFQTKRPVEAAMLESEPFEHWVYGFIMALSTLSLIGVDAEAAGIQVTDLGPLSWIQDRQTEVVSTSNTAAREYLASLVERVDAHYS